MKKQQKDIPRRHFLRSALGSSLCSSAFLNACAKIEEPQSWKMTLSTSSVQYRTESLEEALRRIGKMGFEESISGPTSNGEGLSVNTLKRGLKPGWINSPPS
jgi:hypothetical protein